MKFTTHISSFSTENLCFYSGEYRYGFNGKDRESELNSGAYDFGARIHDARLGRWMSVDPLVADNTYLSPYNSCDNSPIAINDPDGKNAKITVDENSKTITFSIQLTLIGDDATQAKATEIQAAVLQYWKATGFSYTDESGKKYDVNFECEVITGDQAIANIGMVEPYGNLVRLDASEDRSYVEGGWYGHWNPNAEASVFAHEVGHMLGLADAYVEYMYTDAGCMNCTDEERKEHYFTNWTSVQDENEIMGVAGGSNNNKPQVSQRDINALAGYALEHAPVLDGTTYITGNADLNGPTSADKLEYSGTGFVVEVAPNERVGQ